MQHTEALRSLIQAPDLLVMPGIFDGFSARLVEQSGFPAGFISGGGLSETLLGYSDVGLMGFELNLAAVTRLVACCTIPLLADADTGYGNAVNVYHTARAFEQAGLAGLMIEDQTWPKRCGHMSGKEVIPVTACAIRGMQHGVAALREAMHSTTVIERPELAVSFEELNALVGFAEVQERERRYTPKATPAREGQTR
jgi:2-methylisocitrate lyase-like PEP mutase family enzyme